MRWTQAEFVEKVIEVLGMKGPTDLGVALGKKNAYNTVHSWVRATPKPTKLGYEDTMAMLEMCGWLAIEEEPGQVARIEPPDRRLESIAKMVKETLANTNELLGVPEPARKAAPRRPKRKRSAG